MNVFLDSRQKRMLRLLADGLKAGLVQPQWVMKVGVNGVTITNGLETPDTPQELKDAWNGITGSDFDDFAKSKLFEVGTRTFGGNAITWKKERLIELADNDFHFGSPPQPSPQMSSGNMSSEKYPEEMIGDLINRIYNASPQDEDGIALVRKLALRLGKKVFGEDSELTRQAESSIYIDNLGKRRQELMTILHEMEMELRLTKYINLTNNDIFGQPDAGGRFSKDIFMVMPFNKPDLEDVYRNHVIPATESVGLTIKRGDDVFSGRDIIHDIWSFINNSRIIIAECTEKNANVYYEVGIAHTINKPVILITQKIDELPFDLKGKRAINYVFSVEGLKNLETELKAAIKSILA